MFAAVALAGGSSLAQTVGNGEDAVAPAAPPPLAKPSEPAKIVHKADPAPNPDDDASDEAPAKPAEPAKRPHLTAAVIQALDKVTTETLRFEVQVNQPVRYKDLVFTVHDCETNASDEAQPGAFAHLEIDSQPKALPGMSAPPARQLFSGWMFSNAPGIHPFEHPVYDAWLIACKTATPGS
jgi:hypothetical protein